MTQDSAALLKRKSTPYVTFFKDAGARRLGSAELSKLASTLDHALEGSGRMTNTSSMQSSLQRLRIYPVISAMPGTRVTLVRTLLKVTCNSPTRAHVGQKIEMCV